jgi:hypothetical protein
MAGGPGEMHVITIISFYKYIFLGYILSKNALKRFAMAIRENSKCRQSYVGSEDKQMGIFYTNSTKLLIQIYNFLL